MNQFLGVYRRSEDESSYAARPSDTTLPTFNGFLAQDVNANVYANVNAHVNSTVTVSPKVLKKVIDTILQGAININYSQNATMLSALTNL